MEIDCIKLNYRCLIFCIKSVIVSTILVGAKLFCIEFSAEPISIYKTPNSIIHKLSPAWAQNVENRMRFSTCTGVAWSADNTHLISANLLEESLQVYRFKKKSHTIVAKQKYMNDVTQIGWPENLSISRDGSLLAVSNSKLGKALIYQIDPQKNRLSPIPISLARASDHGLHGIRFSHDGRYLAYVTYDGLGKVRIFKKCVSIDGTLSFELTDTMNSTFQYVATKGIDFSHDMKYVAICYSIQIRPGWSEQSGKVAIFRFDALNGKMDQTPLCEIGVEHYLSTPEDIQFYIDDSIVLVSNQGNDTISAHQFDRETGMITQSRVVLSSPSAQLNFPHGISISSDGAYLAVSNYGDDKITVYAIE